MLESLTPKQAIIQQRTDQMLKLLFQGHMTFTKIAEAIGVERTVAYDYWNAWKKTEEASALDWEWWELYNRVKENNPDKALECLTRLKYKMIVEKIETKTEITSEEKVQLNVTDDEDAIIRKANDIINRKLQGTTKPASIH